MLISKPNFGTAIAAAARLNRQPQKPDFSTAIAAAARLNRQPKRSALERSSIRWPFIFVGERTMGKEDILKIVQDGWEEYKTRILPNTYLYLYNDGQGIKTKQRRTSKRSFIQKGNTPRPQNKSLHTSARKTKQKGAHQNDHLYQKTTHQYRKIKISAPRLAKQQNEKDLHQKEHLDKK